MSKKFTFALLCKKYGKNYSERERERQRERKGDFQLNVK
jgi:hypothetical protein